MLRLVIDVGNTQLKLFFFKENSISASQVFKTDEQAAIFVKNLNLGSEKVNCIISKVRNISNALFACLSEKFNIIEFTNKLILPIKITYKTSNTLGKDRIADIVGASVIFPRENVLVIDAGTAITYDILEKDFTYPGGNISPGLATRFKSLHTFTENLPLLSIKKGKTELFGKTTADAIICGVQNGILHEILGVIAEFEENYSDLKVVFTGGDCFFFEKLLKNRIFVSPNLTAIGLNKILELNV